MKEIRLLVWFGVTCVSSLWLLLSAGNPFDAQALVATNPDYVVEQITFGPKHHLFGYIGHAGTIPWNASGRYVLALRAGFEDHMPGPNEPADILLLDTKAGYLARKIAETRAWNLQQGSMMYWNPEAPDTQFFFNDRDPDNGRLFTVLFDISRGENGERVKEFRFDHTPIGNSGVAQQGGSFLALNYGRLGRLRLVTGYAGLEDWSQQENAPEDDGIFKVDVATGNKQLIVSYRQLREALRSDFPVIDQWPLFINHTLWNRPSDRIYFFVRANFRSELTKIDVPFTVNADGTGLTRHPYLGGHPEWGEGQILICSDGKQQIRYDTSSQKIIGKIGALDTFADPGGDICFSPNQKWFINGHKNKELKQTFFTLFQEQQNRVIRTGGFPIGDWLSGELRIDPAPSWSRDSRQLLIGAFDPMTETRQLFVLTIKHP